MSRFEHITASGVERRASWDHILFEDDDLIVVPTKGSLLPYWLLIIPKVPVLNFQQYLSLSGQDPIQLAKYVVDQIKLDAEDLVWFEHGAIEMGSVVGCGVDQAHLHILVKPPFDLAQFMTVNKRFSGVQWTPNSPKSVYSALRSDHEYYICGDQTHSFFTHSAKAETQFFRKSVAKLIGKESEWNYNEYAGEENVNFTVRDLSVPITDVP